MPSTLPVTLGLLLAALVYLRGWNHLRSTIPDAIPDMRSFRRPAAFLGGLACIWIAVGSPLAMMDEELLTVHMVQHLLLMTAAPPLIWLSSPVLPFLHGLPKFAMRGALGPLLRIPLVQSLGQFLANPVFCWFAATTVLMGWHVPAAFALGMSSEFWHHAEHASFVLAGLLFWWPVVPSWPSVSNPRWPIVMYLFLATLPCDALSAFLVFCGRVVYPAYLDAPRHTAMSPLQDQQCAGALMWACVTFAYLVPAVVITTRLLSNREMYEEAPSVPTIRAKLRPDECTDPQ
ncbi:MAG: cytochrome c oxidase assembly protein [Bryobacteraceae bacterium]